jgi:anti-anti-sigma regulatory factor
MRMMETDADGVMVVEAHGRLDSTTSKAFGDRLTSLLETGHGALVVDLRSIAYISSVSGSAEGQPSRGGAGVQVRALRGDRGS